MVDSGAMHNVMPLFFMKTIGLDCTGHYEDGECVFSINSRIMLAYAEIKYLYVRISSSHHVNIVLTIIFIDLPS